VVALGLDVADPLIGLAITAVILRITWQSWRTVRGRDDQHRVVSGNHGYTRVVLRCSDARQRQLGPARLSPSS
jgi:hypothetical protein